MATVAPPVGDVHDLTAEARAPVTLTRVAHGSRGPVLLVHGAGVSSSMFALPTQRTTLAGYLGSRDYDVWLLDWRASIIHPPRRFTFDEAAADDMPAAVRRVREVTGADSVQAVVHCAGALAWFMAMASGLLPDVRGVVASQVALHVDVPPASRLKARVGLAGLLDRVGVAAMSPADDDGHPAIQRALGVATGAVHHECTSRYCHRLTFIYGHLFHHAQLDQATHDALPDHFGRCGTLSLRHLSRMIDRGHACPFDGVADAYLDPTHLRVPITFLSGSRNRVWLPSSTDRTHQWLAAAHGPELYARHVLDGYGHLDTIMGTNAATDTFPLIAAGLERS